MRITSSNLRRAKGRVLVIIVFCALPLFGRHTFTSKFDARPDGALSAPGVSPRAKSATAPSVATLLAQFSQQGTKLIGSGAVGTASQGYSVSISSDGDTAIVGGPFDNGFVGAAWVWTRSGGVWSQQGSKLVGSDAVGASWQGFSVSLSADGNTAIIGGPNDNSNAGAAWVWTRSGGVWTQQGAKLVGSGAVGTAQQGHSVSLSADGNTAIVGGNRDDSFAGAAWVWTRSAGVWTQEGAKLVGSGAVGSANQGYSVSISGDGNTAIVGGENDNTFAGAAWVWTRSGGIWTQQGTKLVGTGAVGNAQQGHSVSLSVDGNTAIVGGNGDNSAAGAAWIWTRSGSVWTQQGTKLVGSGAVGGAQQGVSVTLSDDGNIALVGGASDNSGTGAVWVWTRSGGVWTQQGTKLVASDAVGSAQQGNSVSLSADGSTAIVGGPGNEAAWVFINSPTTLQIDDVSPPAGRTSGGQEIVLTGAFAGLSTVTMGGVSASWVYTNGAGDTTSITVTTPAHAVGAVQIDLTPTSGSPYSKANAFAYLPTVFTDDTITVGQTTVKAQHVIELRQAVDAMRAVAGLAPAAWTDATLTPGSSIIKAIHIQELRTYLDDAATQLGYSTSAYTDPSLTTGYSIKRIHIEELRQRIRVIAG